MDAMEASLTSLVGKTYVQQGLQGIASRHNLFKALLSSREMPSKGWDDLSIELILAELSAMDSNNFPSNIGAGEREGRVYSGIVGRRHFRLSHGIGRSGNISEVQPKSAGSSIIAKITTYLLYSALKLSGLNFIKELVIVPLATGMSLMMCMSVLRSKHHIAKYVIFPRIDQKSCFKSILTANLIPLPVDGLLIDDQIVTDVNKIKELFMQYGDEILCVLSTTSCFAPRAPDAVDDIAILCLQFNIAHIINHAYGVQCSSLNRLVNRAMTLGRVDFLVSSLDKNFMVPVGGAFIASQSSDNVMMVSQFYPGRASASPTIDLFITLLSMGKEGFSLLLRRREELMAKLQLQVDALAEKHGERLLVTSANPISLAISLVTLQTKSKQDSVTYFGSMLFQRCISGARVVPKNAKIKIGLFTFEGWGAHCAYYPIPYMTLACAIGMNEEDIYLLIEKLDKTLSRISNRHPEI